MYDELVQCNMQSSGVSSQVKNEYKLGGYYAKQAHAQLSFQISGKQLMMGKKVLQNGFMLKNLLLTTTTTRMK